MIKFHYNRAQLSGKTINILSQDKVIYIYNEGGTRKGAMVIDRENIDRNSRVFCNDFNF